MIQLLNRLSWGISISLGLFICLIFAGSPSWYNQSEEAGAILLLWTLLWTIIKWLIFKRKYIENRVQHFTHVALKGSFNQESTSSANTTHVTEDVKDVSPVASEEEYVELDMSSPVYSEKQDIYDSEEKVSEPVQKPYIVEYIEKFFSENILAKIGGILVFLWVIFLLSLVWSYIPWVLKLLMGFVIWMSVYWAGTMLEKKGLENEWRILLGIAILINYAVILSGRYIIGWTWIDSDPYFSAATTFVFLILNTLFAVLTSLYYKSWVLLVFSFLAAYFNPFLVGWDASSPYILVGYSLIISYWALFLAHKEKSLWLLVSAFTLWNLLVFIAPNPSWAEVWYIVKHISLIILTLSCLVTSVSMKISQKWIIEILFAWSFFIVWLFWVLWSPSDISFISYAINIIAAFIFMWVSYFYIKRWSFLFSIGSIGGALILSSQFAWDKIDLLAISILSLVLYAMINIVISIRMPIKDASSLKNLVLWSVWWVLFIGFSLYQFEIHTDFLGQIWLWMTYFFIGLIYFYVSYFQMNRIGLEKVKESVLYQNSLYNFLAISVSLVSISIALIFSEYNFVVALFWLFESSIILYFYTKVGDIKIALAAIVLMLSWIIEWIHTISGINARSEYLYLVPVFFALASLLFSSIQSKSISIPAVKNFHDIAHIIWIIFVLLFIPNIFAELQDIWILAILTVFLAVLAYFYKIYWSKLQKWWFVWLYIFYLMSSAGVYINDVFWRWWELQYTLSHDLLSALLMGVAYIYSFPLKKSHFGQKPVFILALSYLFIITSFYIHDIFNNTFAVTIYWWILAFSLLSHGIGKDKIAFRTLGLYLITLMCLKIFFIDIGVAISDTVIKVIAFITVWIMLIVISTMYSRKYGSKLKWEFQLSNLFTQSNNNSAEEPKMSSPESIHIQLDAIDVSDIQSVTFQPNGAKPFSTKSQNLMKIVKMVMKDTKQQEFAPNELISAYKMITANYQSNLTKTEYNRVKWVIYDFVVSWWTVTIK